MSIAYHPQTDGSECAITTIQGTLDDKCFRACILAFRGSWCSRILLGENTSQIKDDIRLHVDRLRKSYADKRRTASKRLVLDWHEELDGVHDTFHPVEILEREFKKLKRSRISIVKVRWNSKRGPEFTWELFSAAVEELNRNIEMEPDIENMMMNEYLEYEAAKERKLWDDVRSRKSPTNYDNANVDSFHQNKNIVQDSIWDQDDDLEEDQEDDGNDRDTFDIWDITTEDVERIRQFFTPNVPDVIENILNVAMVNEGVKCNPAKDLEELEILLAKEPQSNFTGI
ncbi:hypothetical protein Tco_1465634 [Tanacetum coccineum]